MVSSPSPENGPTVRPFRPDDEPRVRELIDAERLPGQPPCTPERMAASRCGPVPPVGWAVRDRPQISVLAGAGDRPQGAIAYLSWADVHTGVICWVHAHEKPSALRALIEHALASLAHCSLIEAFVGGPPGPLGPGGLPRAHRGATHDVLLHSGFTGRCQGRYLYCALSPELPPAEPVADVVPCGFPQGQRLIVREAAEPVAEAVISLGPDRTATVYWIETLPTHRRRGLGHELLGQALSLLAERGATEVALVVDDPAHAGQDSQAAPRLFDSFGFTLVDQLWTYQCRHPA
ncbi:GNAT family N-acetyltransferase [Streptomyces sp. CA-210063]|uniref:GNAT family N-acetyltransferase n=1 Tax=Streptomyces sp. CA-210063 TaxID=2801029 RepID=UPI00214AD5A3|nr:GNAT family N-acetyltransferase [Streptomyces sp. CA-210063]UUU36183.1 GNAT family N-acetyltransferase [Streptomyces sp. CA-210063]